MRSPRDLAQLGWSQHSLLREVLSAPRQGRQWTVDTALDCVLTATQVLSWLSLFARLGCPGGELLSWEGGGAVLGSKAEKPRPFPPCRWEPRQKGATQR